MCMYLVNNEPFEICKTDIGMARLKHPPHVVSHFSQFGGYHILSACGLYDCLGIGEYFDLLWAYVMVCCEHFIRVLIHLLL